MAGQKRKMALRLITMSPGRGRRILEKFYPNTCNLEHLRKGQLFRKKDLGKGVARETGQGEAD